MFGAIKRGIKRFILKWSHRIYQWAMLHENEQLYKKHNIPASAKLHKVSIIGQAKIGAHTYINDGSLLSSGPNSCVHIGRHCAIGRYVHISAKTHSLEFPTSDEQHAQNVNVEADTHIGDYVWIGDKVFIREGVTIGDYAIIGANSVVLKDVEPFEIVGGIPAKHIRYNTAHYKYESKT